MTNLEARRMVVQLAALTEERSRPEQTALLDVARKVDKQTNKQTIGNPSLAGVLAGPCDFTGAHDKTCICRGRGEQVRKPVNGWSRLADLVVATWDRPEPAAPKRTELDGQLQIDVP